jgi:hypothetical protein
VDRRQVLRASAAAAAALLVGCRRGGPDVGADGITGTTSPDVDTQSPAPSPSPPRPAPEPPEPAPPEPEPEASEPEVATARIEVLCRDVIGLAAATAGGVQHRIERVTLHHTGVELGDNALAPSRLRRHQGMHQQHGWSDIAYHYGVDLRGNVYELRDPGVAGDTFTDYDPAGHLLLLCEGNYDLESPTDRQLTSVAELIALGAQRFGVDPGSLTGHRDHVVTSCPGDRLYARQPELIAEAQRLARTVSYGLDVRCDEEARARVAAIEAGA